MKPIIITDFLNANILDTQIYNASRLIGLEEEVKLAKTVFIKPNLTFPVYKKGVTTRVEFVRSLVLVLTQINSALKIYIGEGEGGYNSFSMSEAFRNMGFLKLEKEFPQLRMVNLSKMASKQITITTAGGPYLLDLPEIFFDEIDFSISCPVPKIHAITKVSLAYKNQWGCLPDTMRLKNHHRFNGLISQISQILKFKYAFLDGKYGLDNNGPMYGIPVEVNWFAASNSLGAFDTIVSGMMGFDWKKIGYLRQADKLGHIPHREEIEIVGNYRQLKRKFVLKRKFRHYPALFAFRSKQLTRFFYLSRYAGMLHNIYYNLFFKSKPISLR